MDNSVKASLVTISKCKSLCDLCGDAQVAKWLGCSRPTLARIMAGLGVMPAGLALAEHLLPLAESRALDQVAA